MLNKQACLSDVSNNDLIVTKLMFAYDCMHYILKH